jgi:hypothetical protein
MADTEIIDESHKISDKRGNGKLRREIWVDSITGKVTRYNLAYINHRLYAATTDASWVTTTPTMATTAITSGWWNPWTS